MDRFLRFLAGAGLAVFYFVLALIIANGVLQLSPDLWLICLAVVVIGWIAMFIIAFRKDQRWIGYGVFAAPFIALLVATISCFVAFSVNQS